jgi:hypothetical protein
MDRDGDFGILKLSLSPSMEVNAKNPRQTLAHSSACNCTVCRNGGAGEGEIQE